MDSNKQVLNPPEVVVVPPTTETPVPEVVNEAEPTSQPEVAPETQSEAEQPIPPAPAANLDVDEFGVPWKNRAMEWQRKSEQLVDRLPQIVEEKLRTVTQPQQPQYTFEQLEAYKLQNAQDPNVVAWATGEQRKLDETKQRHMFEEIVGQRDRQREFELSRQRSFEYVQKTFPDALNPNHPIARGISEYMRNPDLANHPNGLMLAAKAAYADYALGQTNNLQQTAQQLKREVKVLQKSGLVEGAGKRVVTTATPQQAAMENLKKSGSLKDAESAIGAILRQGGIIQD